MPARYQDTRDALPRWVMKMPFALNGSLDRWKGLVHGDWYPEAVIASPGGLVSDAGTFNLLLAQCTTVWLQAAPEDHMKRVAAQGDMRPMAASREAMADLKRILAGRAAFYSKAELRLDTSAQALAPTFLALRALVRRALQLPE